MDTKGTLKWICKNVISSIKILNDLQMPKFGLNNKFRRAGKWFNTAREITSPIIKK